MGTGTHQNAAGETPRALVRSQPSDGSSRNRSGYLSSEGGENIGRIYAALFFLRESAQTTGVLRSSPAAIFAETQKQDHLLLVRAGTSA